MYKRLQKFIDIGNNSAFLWGARQTGKSTLLHQRFPNSIYFDLLLSQEYERLVNRPYAMREQLLESNIKSGSVIIIDEVQKIPALMDEVHWFIVNKKLQFILCGSSPRKLIRSGGNLLGGRAIRYELYPLVSAEIKDFKLLRALNHGLIPTHYISETPDVLISSYIGNYLKEEIAAEAMVRRIPSFARFLEAASFSNGEIVNYQNIASECGVSSHTIKEYFQILEDTLIARFLPSFQKKPKRRVILAPKFYYFDVAIANHLLKRGPIAQRSEAFGRAFEHFIYQEIYAHSKYSGIDYPIAYWRTASQYEVDFILGDHEIALEVKSTDMAMPHHLKGLKAFSEEYRVKYSIIVTQDLHPRKIGGITVLPWKVFLEKLWNKEIIK
ncbi:MAG: AAA family ATPase [Elusimicrobia bacterium]|nr:AAA family ATPase [Candidatus Liberimonas magnetica]